MAPRDGRGNVKRSLFTVKKKLKGESLIRYFASTKWGIPSRICPKACSIVPVASAREEMTKADEQRKTKRACKGELFTDLSGKADPTSIWGVIFQAHRGKVQKRHRLKELTKGHRAKEGPNKNHLQKGISVQGNFL